MYNLNIKHTCINEQHNKIVDLYLQNLNKLEEKIGK